MYPHQDIILNDPSPLIDMNIARGTGKSVTAAVKATHGAYFNDNYLVLIMSATKPQAIEIIRKIKNFMKTSYFTKWSQIYPKGKENKAEIELRNPNGKTYSRIISVPATDAARGYSPNLIICDELAFWEDPLVFPQVVLGMLNRIDGINRKILALSTPNGKHGPHWDAYNSPNWSVYDFDWRVNPSNTEEKMNVLRETMTHLQFKAEYEADFVSSQSSYFTLSEIQNALSSEANQGYKGEVNCVVSVDFGKLHDKCVINVGYIINPEKPKNEQIIRVIDRRVKPLGTDYSFIIAELKAINDSIHPSLFILDSTGVGEGPSDILKALGLPCEFFKFSLFSKVSIMNNLKILFQNKRIQIPNEKELINELELFEYEASESGGVSQPKLHAPQGYHDDEVDSLALLAWALSKRGFSYCSLVSTEEAFSIPFVSV